MMAAFKPLLIRGSFRKGYVVVATKFNKNNVSHWFITKKDKYFFLRIFIIRIKLLFA